MRRARLVLGGAMLALLCPALALAVGPRDAGAPAADAGALQADGGPLGADAAAADAGAADDAGGAADAGAADVDAGAASAGPVLGTCVEHVPTGTSRPHVKEAFPARGISGYASELRLVINHGKGETVLPEGFKLQGSSDAARALEQAGFVIPDPEGGARATLKVEPGETGKSITTLTIPIVPLPPKPGRNAMLLPPLPIAVARANNEYLTLCTAPHPMVVEDPIANELNPKVKTNPPPRPQRVDWPLARNLAIGVPIGVVLTLLGVLLYRWWAKRPRVEPEAPKVPPWITALAELEEIRRSDMLARGRMGEYFDRVSDCLRSYLGFRYGFETIEAGYNGLETTTGEMIALLKRVRPPVLELPRIKEFLDECDLVKFARVEPDETGCLEALRRVELIVRMTIPVMTPAARADGRPAAEEAAP
jgi:hypothetical protein